MVRHTLKNLVAIYDIAKYRVKFKVKFLTT